VSAYSCAVDCTENARFCREGRSCRAQGRACPVPCGAEAAAAAAMSATASARLGAVEDGSSTCVVSQNAQRARRGFSRVRVPPAAGSPDPAVALRPQPVGAARRAGQRAGREVRGHGVRIGAQQHGGYSRSRQPGLVSTGRETRRAPDDTPAGP